MTNLYRESLAANASVKPATIKFRDSWLLPALMVVLAFVSSAALFYIPYGPGYGPVIWQFVGWGDILLSFVLVFAAVITSVRLLLKYLDSW